MRILAVCTNPGDTEALAADISARGHTTTTTSPAASSSKTHLWKPDVVLARAANLHEGWMLVRDPAVRPLILWIDEAGAEPPFEQSRVTVRSGAFKLDEALALASVYAPA